MTNSKISRRFIAWESHGGDSIRMLGLVDEDRLESLGAQRAAAAIGRALREQGMKDARMLPTELHRRSDTEAFYPVSIEVVDPTEPEPYVWGFTVQFELAVEAMQADQTQLRRMAELDDKLFAETPSHLPEGIRAHDSADETFSPGDLVHDFDNGWGVHDGTRVVWIKADADGFSSLVRSHIDEYTGIAREWAEKLIAERAT